MYRTVETATWGDPWFSELEARAKLLFLYLLTNHRTTACGTVEITARLAEFETGLTRYTDSIALLAPKVMYWPDYNIAWVRRFYKHQRSNSSWKFDIMARKAMFDLPPAIQDVIAGEYPILSLAIPYPYPIATSGGKQNGTADQRTTDRVYETASLTYTEHNIPVTEHSKTKHTYTCADRAHFDVAWAAYPRKTSKAKAWEKWERMPITDDLYAIILGAINDQATWPQWQAGTVPHMTTWLNGQRWDDERPPDQVQRSNGHRPDRMEAERASSIEALAMIRGLQKGVADGTDTGSTPDATSHHGGYLPAGPTDDRHGEDGTLSGTGRSGR